MRTRPGAIHYHLPHSQKTTKNSTKTAQCRLPPGSWNIDQHTAMKKRQCSNPADLPLTAHQKSSSSTPNKPPHGIQRPPADTPHGTSCPPDAIAEQSARCSRRRRPDTSGLLAILQTPNSSNTLQKRPYRPSILRHGRRAPANRLAPLK